MTLRTFAGVSPELVDSFVERVELGAGDAPIAAALDRWRELAAQGWDVTALGAVDGSHLIGLGCRYVELAAQGASLSA